MKCSALPRLIMGRWPGARVTFLTSEAHAELLQGNPHLERVIAFERRTGLGGLRRLARGLRGEGVDLVVDVHRSLRSRLLCAMLRAPRTAYSKRSLQRWLLLHWRIHRFPETPRKEADFLAGLLPWGVRDDGEGTELHVEHLDGEGALSGRYALEKGRIDRWREEGRPVLGVAPVAAWPLKRWPLAHVRDLLERFLTETRGAVVVFGGPGEDEVQAVAEALSGSGARNSEGEASGERVLSLAGRTNLMESAWFAARCDLMLANDTGMGHIAEAVGVDALVLFGPTTREWGYFPGRPSSRVLERSLPCRPCTRTGSGRCTNPAPHACLAGLAPETVLETIREMLRI